MNCTTQLRHFTLISCLILSCFFSTTLAKSNDDNQLPSRFHKDPDSLRLASTDYGHIVTEYPKAVLYPSSPVDILNLVKCTYQNRSSPRFSFTIAARGRSHSVYGQALARGGVVVEMSSLRNGVRVLRDESSGCYYADVGSQMLWIDVLNATLKHGLAPVTWTDYLYLTVGGTLSNAGIGGQAFRFGPQISNVYEMDVITGTGEFVTCSPTKDSNLFYAVLGGLGQFGIITRARIVLNQAPKRVKWVRLLYSNFSTFTEDQERLISVNGRNDKNALDYLEGMLLLNKLGESDDWRSFFPPETHSNISSLIAKHGIIYGIELAKFYNETTQKSVEEELQSLFKLLRFIPGYNYGKDVSYVDFLNRVRVGELQLRSQGLWEVPHPWLNLFIPKSGIINFNEGALRNIMLKRNITAGPVLIYPMNRNKWHDKTSAVIPEEGIFYAVGFLHASGFNNWQIYVDQNQEMLRYCENAGIKVKQYLGHHNTQEEWINHFGPLWNTFVERKNEFDPKMILSPGQKIFNKSIST